MTIEATLKNVLALLEKMLIPGSESLKMQAVKNDINAVIRAVQEPQTKQEEAKEGQTNEA